jgi:hypothetical protein
LNFDVETVFERVECRSGFLGKPYILEQSHQPQPHGSGLEAVPHLVCKLVVNCEHGSVSFRDASDVTDTLRSPWSRCLIHEIKRKKSSGAGKGMHRATSPFVAGKYALKRIIQQYQFFRRQDKLAAFFIPSELLLTKQAVWVL